MMDNKKFQGYVILLFCTVLFGLVPKNAKAQDEQKTDTISFRSPVTHRMEVDFRPEYIIPFNSFLQGMNDENKSLKSSLSAHLRYSFQYKEGSLLERVYGHDTYQGIGIAHYVFDDKKELGNPTAVYVFQGSQIAKLTHSLSLNYEWNFGLSFGWNPYDPEKNSNNTIIGSNTNAYIFAGIYLCQRISREFDLVAGYSFTHFSNGNTRLPNAGLNTTGLRLGIVYNISKPDSKPVRMELAPQFYRHWNYDLLLFGAWKRTGVDVGGDKYLSPDSYGVYGFNFTSLYNFSYRFKAGVSLDGLQDEAAGAYAKDYISPLGHEKPEGPPEFSKLPYRNRLALGLSGRIEYVMPFFTIDVGMGANVLAGCSNLKTFYQILALKMNVTHNTFLHIGYCLKNFHNPNHLMLGFGIHLHNKRAILK